MVGRTVLPASGFTCRTRILLPPHEHAFDRLVVEIYCPEQIGRFDELNAG
jgi:hypothetical protein